MKKILILMLLLTACEVVEKPEREQLVTVEMNMVDGKTYIETFSLPEKIYLYVRTDEGSYRLCWAYKDTNWFNYNPSGNTVKAGVINFHRK